MARGYTKITLVGGKRSGDIIEDVPLYHLPDTLAYDSDTYFIETADGGMACFARVEGVMRDSWDSFSREIYTKRENDQRSVGTIFEYSKTIMIGRCEANTAKGKRCLKPALEGKSYCSTVHKPK